MVGGSKGGKEMTFFLVNFSNPVSKYPSTYHCELNENSSLSLIKGLDDIERRVGRALRRIYPPLARAGPLQTPADSGIARPLVVAAQATRRSHHVAMQLDADHCASPSFGGSLLRCTGSTLAEAVIFTLVTLTDIRGARLRHSKKCISSQRPLYKQETFTVDKPNMFHYSHTIQQQREGRIRWKPQQTKTQWTGYSTRHTTRDKSDRT